MSKATQSNTLPLSPVQQAAADIAALVNRSPATPSVDQIAAVIQRVQAPASAVGALPSISTIAFEIGRLAEFITLMEEAESLDNKAESAIATRGEPVWFRDFEHAAAAKKDALETLMLTLEAETLEEALALLLVTADHFNSFSSNHSNHENRGVEKEADEIETALQAIARCLIHRIGVTTPIRQHYFGGSASEPRSTAVARALERARELIPADGEGSRHG